VEYYSQIQMAPNMWCETSVRYDGPEQLEELGLMSRINW